MSTVPNIQNNVNILNGRLYARQKENPKICTVLISHGCHLVGMSTDTTTGVHVPKISMYCMKFPYMASRWGSHMQWVHRTVKPAVFEKTSFNYYTLKWFWYSSSQNQQETRNWYLLLSEQCHDPHSNLLSDCTKRSIQHMIKKMHILVF